MITAGIGDQYDTWDDINYYYTEEEWAKKLEEEPDLASWDRLDYCADNTDFGWELFIDALDELLEELDMLSICIDVENQGWMHRDGYKYATVDGGQELMWACGFNSADHKLKVHHYTSPKGIKGIAIEAAHHDAPMGGE